ncbi:MAG: LysR family transcriptional regulator [Halobacteriovoraceae bacterium]|jgi:LysR family transcriptional regulator, hydrogen peroxide-inducible genes activator|nr:LysR family transcriptional regulator [Halobacteriovoraceae bacterium]
MTLTQLEYIVAVNREGNFRRAALSCFVTQPTLSAQIHKVEDELGVIIFDRTKSPTVPTEIGKKIIKQAMLGLGEIYKIPELIQEETGTLQGSLRIGIIPTISPYLTPLFLKPFCEKYPEVELSLLELPTKECLHKLSREEIDFAILATQEEGQNLLQEHIYDEELFLFINKENVLYKKKKISTKDINAKEIWLLEEGHCLRDEIIETCKLRNQINMRPSKVDFRVGSLESLKYIVQDTYGYTLLPKLATLRLSRSEFKLVRKFSGKTPPSRSIYLTKNRAHLKLSLINAFKNVVLQSTMKALASKDLKE